MMGNTGVEKDSSGSETQSHSESEKPDLQLYSEWTHTGQFRDHGAPKAVCQLCGNTGLRYHFLIAHRETGEAKWIGSQCILNFDLSADAAQARKVQAQKQTEVEKSRAHLLAVLQEVQGVYDLVNEKDKRKIRWIIGRYQRRGGFSPADLAWLFQAMAICGVVPGFHLYSVVLRTRHDRNEIRQMPITRIRMIAACLSETQRRKCEKWGIRLGLD